jgi:glycerophosphoryl diester phosphodiesterase
MNIKQMPQWERVNASDNQANVTTLNTAIASGAPGLTLSVQANRDGVAYLYHDEYILGAQGGYFCYCSNEDVDAIKVDGASIMTLDSALQTIMNHALFNNTLMINIELRGMKSIDAVKQVLNPLLKQRLLAAPQCVLSGFDQVVIKRAGQTLPMLSRAICIVGTPIDYGACLHRCDAHEMHITNNVVDQSLINDVKARGGLVRIDVSSNPHIGRIESQYIDGIIK